MNDIERQHSAMVETFCKNGETVADETTAFKADLNHMALGIGGEAGELQDCIKKFTIYGKPIDLDNVIEELGDLEWYMSHLRLILGLNREQVLLANIDKLKKRYAEGTYSDKQAQQRADKVVYCNCDNPETELIGHNLYCKHCHLPCLANI